LPWKGLQNHCTWPSSPSFRPRSHHDAGASSLTTTARPARNGSPASSPPDFKRDSNTASKVVLPDFHTLVSKVTAPGRR
jgi:hypothetical protein